MASLKLLLESSHTRCHGCSAASVDYCCVQGLLRLQCQASSPFDLLEQQAVGLRVSSLALLKHNACVNAIVQLQGYYSLTCMLLPQGTAGLDACFRGWLLFLSRPPPKAGRGSARLVSRAPGIQCM